MISRIRGELVARGEASVIIECSGIGYEVFVTQGRLQTLPPLGSELLFHTYLQVREDGLSLFGFAAKEELSVFKLLIGVSGIGPKGALGILSSLSVDDLRFAVLSEDANAISKAPGIGKKTAGKLIIELKDKFKLADAFEERFENVQTAAAANGIRDEATQALMTLGYSATDALRAVSGVEVTAEMTVEELLKRSLKNI